jgi:hypothetical protein
MALSANSVNSMEPLYREGLLTSGDQVVGRQRHAQMFLVAGCVRSHFL